MKRHPIAGAVTWAVLAFLHLPVVLLMAWSFNDSRYGGPWKGFTTIWYARLWESGEIWRAFGMTLAIAAVATLLAVILGTSAALALHRAGYRLRGFHFALVYLPLAVPDLLMGISLLLFFVMLHIQLGYATILVAHTTFCIGYVAMVVLGRLQQFETCSLDAARDLGANRLQALRYVLLPQLAPAITAGALLAFTLSIDDFVITFFVAGAGATTLPLRVYSMIRFGSPALINALSTLLVALTALILTALWRFTKEESLT